MPKAYQFKVRIIYHQRSFMRAGLQIHYLIIIYPSLFPLNPKYYSLHAHLFVIAWLFFQHILSTIQTTEKKFVFPYGSTPGSGSSTESRWASRPSGIKTPAVPACFLPIRQTWGQPRVDSTLFHCTTFHSKANLALPTSRLTLQSINPPLLSHPFTS